MDLTLDYLAIGGEPAGLTPAIYLARYCRRFVLIYAEESCAAWTPLSHNHASCSAACDRKPSATARKSIAPRLHSSCPMTRGGEITARTVPLATCVVDIEPELPNRYQAMQRGLVRHFPVCNPPLPQSDTNLHRRGAALEWTQRRPKN